MSGTKYEKYCIYTALFGEYEELNEQPDCIASDIDLICFTDSSVLSSASWQVRKVDPIFDYDPIRSQRHVKIKPHLYLPEYKYSLYIDNSIIIKSDPGKLIDLFDVDRKLMLVPHSFRNSVIDEFIEVSNLGFDDQTRIFEQLNHYLMAEVQTLDKKPYWGGMIFRQHQDPVIEKFGEDWFAQVARYSRRDQLSIRCCLDKNGIVPQELPIDNFASAYHSWPHARSRDRGKGVRSIGDSLTPLSIRYRNTREELKTRTAASVEAQLRLTECQVRLEGAIRERDEQHRLSTDTTALLAEERDRHTTTAAERDALSAANRELATEYARIEAALGAVTAERDRLAEAQSHLVTQLELSLRTAAAEKDHLVGQMAQERAEMERALDLLHAALARPVEARTDRILFRSSKSADAARQHETRRLRELGFDSRFYHEAHPDVKESGIDALDHYVLHGREEGRRIRLTLPAGKGG